MFLLLCGGELLQKFLIAFPGAIPHSFMLCCHFFIILAILSLSRPVFSPLVVDSSSAYLYLNGTSYLLLFALYHFWCHLFSLTPFLLPPFFCYRNILSGSQDEAAPRLTIRGELTVLG